MDTLKLRSKYLLIISLFEDVKPGAQTKEYVILRLCTDCKEDTKQTLESTSASFIDVLM